MVVSYATYIKKAYFITLIWVQFTVQKYWKMKITGNKVFRVLLFFKQVIKIKTAYWFTYVCNDAFIINSLTIR